MAQRMLLAAGNTWKLLRHTQSVVSKPLHEYHPLQGAHFRIAISQFSGTSSEQPAMEPNSPAVESNTDKAKKENFETLFKNSQFVRAMNPVGQRVKGEIIAVVGDNLYVDFGHKFHAVVKRPSTKGELYHKGTLVTLLIKSLELTDHFLGQSKHISLLEAEAELLGLFDE